VRRTTSASWPWWSRKGEVARAEDRGYKSRRAEHARDRAGERRERQRLAEKRARAAGASSGVVVDEAEEERFVDGDVGGSEPEPAR
jgi:hypothetical protein